MGECVRSVSRTAPENSGLLHRGPVGTEGSARPGGTALIVAFTLSMQPLALAAHTPPPAPELVLIAVDADLPAAVVQIQSAALRVVHLDDRIADSDWMVRQISARQLVLEHPDGDALWIDVASGRITRVTTTAPAQPPVEDWAIHPVQFAPADPAETPETSAPEAP